MTQPLDADALLLVAAPELFFARALRACRDPRSSRRRTRSEREPGGFFWNPHDGQTMAFAAAIAAYGTAPAGRAAKREQRARRPCPSYAVRGVPREPQPLPPRCDRLLEPARTAGCRARRRAELDPELVRAARSPRAARGRYGRRPGARGRCCAPGDGSACSREVAYALAGDTPADAGRPSRRRPTRRSPPTRTGSSAPRRCSGRQAASATSDRSSDDTFRTLPVAGRAEPFDMWVEVRVPSGQESGRWEPPRTFAGRLVRFDAAGPRHRGLRAAIEQATHAQVPPGRVAPRRRRGPGRRALGDRPRRAVSRLRACVERDRAIAPHRAPRAQSPRRLSAP